MARKKQVEKAGNKLLNDSKKREKAKVSDSTTTEEKPTILRATWERAGEFRLAGERNYPKALATLTTNLSAIRPKHPMYAAGSRYPALRQGRNGNSSGKNYYTRDPESGETYQYRMTSNGEEEHAPPTPTPPPLLSLA